jgi:hypothetical protein
MRGFLFFAVVSIVVIFIISIIFCVHVSIRNKHLQEQKIELEEKQALEKMELDLKIAEQNRIKAKIEHDLKIAEQKRIEEQQKRELKKKQIIENNLIVKNSIKQIDVKMDSMSSELNEYFIQKKSLLSQIEELEKRVTVARIKYESVKQKVEAARKIENDSRSSKNRNEGQYNTTYRDSGARGRASREEIEDSQKETRGLAGKTGRLSSQAEIERVKLELIENDLSSVRKELQKIDSKISDIEDTFKLLKKNKMELDLSVISDSNSL